MGSLAPSKGEGCWLKQKRRNHIVFWQERHLASSEHEKLKKKLGFKNTYNSSYERGYKHVVAVFISNSCNFQFISEIKDTESVFVIVKGELDPKEG